MSTQRTRNQQESHLVRKPGRPARASRRSAFGVEALEPRTLLEGSAFPQQAWPSPADQTSPAEILPALPPAELTTSSPKAPLVVSPVDLRARVTLPGEIDVHVSAPFRPRGGTNLFQIPVDDATTEIDMRLRPGADAKPYTAEVYLLDERGREMAGWLLASDSGVVALELGPGSTFDGTSLTIGVARPHLSEVGRHDGFALEVLRILAPLPQDQGPATASPEGDGVGWNDNPATGDDPWPDRGSKYSCMIVPDLSDPVDSLDAGTPGKGSLDNDFSGDGPQGAGSGTPPSPPQFPQTSPNIPATPTPPAPSQPPPQPPPRSPGKPESPASPLVIEKDWPLAIDLVDLDRLPDRSVNESAPGKAVDPEMEPDGEMVASWRGPDGTLMLGAPPAGDRPSPLIATQAASLLDWRPTAAMTLGIAIEFGAGTPPTPAPRGQEVGVQPACSGAPLTPPSTKALATGGVPGEQTPDVCSAPSKRARGLRWTAAIAPFLVGLSFSTVLFASLLLPDIDAAVEAERAARRRERRRP